MSAPIEIASSALRVKHRVTNMMIAGLALALLGIAPTTLAAAGPPASDPKVMTDPPNCSPESNPPPGNFKVVVAVDPTTS